MYQTILIAMYQYDDRYIAEAFRDLWQLHLPELTSAQPLPHPPNDNNHRQDHRPRDHSISPSTVMASDCESPRVSSAAYSTHAGMAGLVGAGHLGDEFVENRLTEGVEIRRHHDKRIRATHDIVAIVGFEPAGRIGVVGTPRQRLRGQDHEAVDGDAL
jgi:hypothetical protein